MREDLVVQRIFRCAGIPEIGERGVADVAVALLGRGSLAYGEHDEPVQLHRSPDRLTIRGSLTCTEISYALACGIALWWHASKPDGLAGCDLAEIAVRILVPLPALRDAVTRLGENERAIANEFVCSIEVARSRLMHLRARPSSGFRVRSIAS